MYTDLPIISAKYFLKFAGAWFATNHAEECKRKISLFYVGFAFLCLFFFNAMNIGRYWGDDMGYVVYACCNILIIILAIFKVIVLRIRRFELATIVSYAERYFWHNNYDSQEQLIFAECQKFCKLWIMFIYCVPSAEIFFYAITPIMSNIGRNKSDRVLPVEVWGNWHAAESPYFELLFVLQMLCVFALAITYVSCDTFLCILNMHVISQFRMLQYRILGFSNANDKPVDTVRYVDRCFATLKKCVQQHQLLIDFCDKLEHVFTFTILGHIIVFSLLMGFQCYEILLSNATISRRFIFVFHVVGSFVHVIIFSYCCHGIMEESTNVCASLYFGSWNALPMDKVGRSLRSAVKIIMIRSLKPCCLTAGGFFPVSLTTATSLFNSTLSYFTLMRESVARSESE